MESFIDVIQGTGIVFIEIICCIIFLSAFFEKRKENIIWQKVSLPLLTMIVYGGTWLFSTHIIIKTFFTFIIISIIMFTCFRVKFIVGIIFTGIFEGILYGIDYLVLLLFYKITLPENPEHILIIFISKMLLFSCVVFINKNWGIKILFHILTNREWLRFLYFPISTIIILIIMLININGITNDKLSNIVGIISMFLVGMNIILLKLLSEIVEREQKLNESNLFDERASNQIEMYKIIADNYYKERKKTHEYKNHMACIAGMLEEGKMQETIEYVSKINGVLRKDPNLIDTNNLAINIVLNSKYQEAIRKDIMVILQLNDLSKIKIKNDDIVVVLSNMLNNAIEACEKLKTDRKIWIKIVDENKMTVISIKNTCEQNILNSLLRTSKNNRIEHGFGISNIREIINKYDGNDYIKQEIGRFIFTILIPHN